MSLNCMFSNFKMRFLPCGQVAHYIRYPYVIPMPPSPVRESLPRVFCAGRRLVAGKFHESEY